MREIHPGDTIDVSWFQNSTGWALLQVLRGDRIEFQRVVASSAGANRFPYVVSRSWRGLFELVLHRFDPLDPSQNGDFLVSSRHRYRVVPARDERLRLSVGPIAEVPDSLLVVLHHPLRLPGRASFFWTTSATDSLEASGLPKGEELEIPDRVPNPFWWNSGSQSAEFRHELSSSVRFGRSWWTGGHPEGTWQAVEAEESAMEDFRPEPFNDAFGLSRAGARTWTGASQLLLHDSSVCKIGIPRGTARLRVGVVGTIGERPLVLDTIVGVPYSQEAWLDVPAVMRLGDTALVGVHFPSRPVGSRIVLRSEGPLKVMGAKDGRW